MRQVAVYDDGSIRYVLFDLALEGTLAQIGRHEFMVTDIAAYFRGSRLESQTEDWVHWIRYDPASGLLRYTWPPDPDSHPLEYDHLFFMRDGG